MKRFNVDELIWFIILLFLNISFIYLIRTEAIFNFVDEDMIKHFYISIAILTIFSIYQFERIFTLRRRKEITDKFIPITFTLIIGVILLFVMPMFAENSSNIINNLEEKYENIVSIDNYNIANEVINNKELYNDKLMVFLGYINNSDNIDGDNSINISRDVVTCCQADKRKVDIKVTGLNSEFKEGQWIVVVGKAFIDTDFTINIIEYKLVNEPKDIYFHQHL